VNRVNQDFGGSGEASNWEYANFDHGTIDAPQPQISKLHLLRSISFS